MMRDWQVIGYVGNAEIVVDRRTWAQSQRIRQRIRNVDAPGREAEELCARIRALLGEHDFPRLEKWLQGADEVELTFGRAQIPDGDGVAPPYLLVTKRLQNKLLQAVFFHADYYGAIHRIDLEDVADDL